MEKGVREEKGAPDGGSLAVDSRIDGRGLAAAAGRQRWTSVEQQQKPVIRWERFLPKRSLRVLLVEYDDSTRHIVTALLRKCSYHVAPVADGLKAWEVMKEKEYKFDLVLTEIAMPSLSGFGLLTKIMGTELCRNIPVIMMSSHDSVGVVLKCMLKGAVDFLVKPVRKNELQNLWQHVWRKHCSSSFANVSENNAGSNHVRANAGNESTTGENSGEGRDTQSSGSKPEMEIESFPKQRSVSREVEQEQPDNGMALLVNASKMDDHEEARDKQVVIEANVAQPIQEAVLAERIKARKHSCIIPPHREEELGFLRSKGGDNFDPGSYRPKDATNQPSQDMINFIASIASGQCSYAVSEKDTLIKEFCEATKSSNIKNAPNFGSLPSGELSLRRPQPNGCVVPEFKDRHILIHSHASAFSRYNDRRTHHSCQESSSSSLCTRNRECSDRCYSHFSSPCTANEKNTSFAPNERLAFPQGKEAGATKYFQVSSNNNNNNEDAGLLSSGPPRENVGVACYSPGEGTDFCRPQPGIISLPIPVRAIPLHTLYAGYGAMLQPIFYTETSLSPHGLAALEKEKVLIPSDQSGHHNNHFIKDPQSTKFHRHEENRHSPMRQGMKDQPIAQGNPRALLWTPVDLANPCGNCSQDILKGSRSNGSGETTDAAMNTGTLPESGNESSVPNCNGIGFDCDRSHRETALIKFRLKRKDRCFEKKVRYHSRKKFAEQRPRVKGQFVRQTVLDFMIRKADD